MQESKVRAGWATVARMEPKGNSSDLSFTRRAARHVCRLRTPKVVIATMAMRFVSNEVENRILIALMIEGST